MVRAGQWEGWAPTQLLGVTLESKKLGILGFGRIGRELAGMAGGFGMEIHYHDIARLPPNLEQGAIYHATDESLVRRHAELGGFPANKISQVFGVIDPSTAE